MLAEGSIPRLPVSMEASSDKMSPKRLPVTMVSKDLGLRSSDIAALSTYLQQKGKLVSICNAVHAKLIQLYWQIGEHETQQLNLCTFE